MNLNFHFLQYFYWIFYTLVDYTYCYQENVFLVSTHDER